MRARTFLVEAKDAQKRPCVSGGAQATPPSPTLPPVKQRTLSLVVQVMRFLEVDGDEVEHHRAVAVLPCDDQRLLFRRLLEQGDEPASEGGRQSYRTTQ